ncbi:hypothetical protein GCM10023172_17340 [Hymenobacter ginsengisoli]|uniref:Uncharacterized protein n=1 Tax=Hymenobacter ginsengisoli TaxID=1051626 RepID=A0ABP8Q8A4_9BACT|nr:MULTISPECIES: hypothetical protein [unclassified Hymenobacter]MBO2030723.1 hypothetical protein [Hymenobacter sp. BT559]
MIAKIKNLYGSFGDAIVERIEYVPIGSNTSGKLLSVYLKCLNWKTEEWEKVKLNFIDVTHFQYSDCKVIQSAVVFEAMIMQNERGIVVDFFPVQVDGLGKLEEDPMSSFLIRCKSISYEVLA